MLPVAVARSLWWECITLCTSGFVDDVIFSHNRLKDDAYVLSTYLLTYLLYKVAAPTAKSVIIDCILLKLSYLSH